MSRCSAVGMARMACDSVAMENDADAGANGQRRPPTQAGPTVRSSGAAGLAATSSHPTLTRVSGLRNHTTGKDGASQDRLPDQRTAPAPSNVRHGRAACHGRRDQHVARGVCHRDRPAPSRAPGGDGARLAASARDFGAQNPRRGASRRPGAPPGRRTPQGSVFGVAGRLIISKDEVPLNGGAKCP